MPIKIPGAGQMQEWDAYTLEHEPVSVIDLMERAAYEAYELVTCYMDESTESVKFFCGKGNNGGDGLVIAYHLLDLKEKGDFQFETDVYILEFGNPGTACFQENLIRLQAITNRIHFIQSPDNFPLIHQQDICIDSLYGTGLNKPVTGLAAELIIHINSCSGFTIAIDLPSGMYTHKCSVDVIKIKADVTLSFQVLKPCFFVAENAAFTGKVEIVDIQLHEDFWLDRDSDIYLTTLDDIKSIYKPRSPFSHKGHYGHVKLIAGTANTAGAALLATAAAVKTGAGLTTLVSEETVLQALRIYLPEAMSATHLKNDSDKKYTYALGPGMGTQDDAVEKLQQVLKMSNNPLVLDADALTILATHSHLIKQIPIHSILTPHPKEFDRLFGDSKNEFERLEKALTISASTNMIMVLKGHYTLVAVDGKAFFNNTGNAGLAKGGSGDVLTGMIAALLAQGYAPDEAAKTGVYLHGLAADIAKTKIAVESLTASDIIAHISAAFRRLLN